MKNALGSMALALALVAGGTAWAQEDHALMTPDQMKWGPGPDALPKGAEATVLVGDPGKPGPFVVRLKFPSGYKIPAHMHPTPEVITVISGTFIWGHGDKADPSAATKLPAGSFVSIPTEMPHFASVDEDTIIQVSSIGPFDVIYVDQADDPRKK